MKFKDEAEFFCELCFFVDFQLDYCYYKLQGINLKEDFV